MIARAKVWRENNKEHSARYKVEYRRKNKEATCRRGKARDANTKAKKHNVSSRLSHKDIIKLMENNPMACNYCNCDLSDREDNGMWQIDHVVPMSSGGPNTLDNIVICCKVCNRKKNNQPVEKFRAQL